MEGCEYYRIIDLGDLQSTPQNFLANFGQKLISIISFYLFYVCIEHLHYTPVEIKGIGWIEYFYW